MNNRNLLYIAISLVFIALLSGLVYFLYFQNTKLDLTNLNIDSSEDTYKGKENLSPGRVPDAFSILENPESDKYKQLRESFRALTNDSQNKTRTNQDFANVYKQAVDVFIDDKLSNRERAYALNIFSLVYATNFNPDPVIDAFTGNSEIYGQYMTFLDQVSKYKKQPSAKTNGVMSNLGTPEKNYAVQKTIAYLNERAYDLYPNSYSLLRQNLNTVQADKILFNNYSLDKNYRNYSEFIKDRYSKEYIDGIGQKLETFKNQSTLYTGTFRAAYEIDIMISTGYLFPLKYLPIRENKDAESAKKKIEVLREINIYANHILTTAARNNQVGSYFFPQAVSSLTKASIVKEGYLDQTESDSIQAEAIDIFKTLMSRKITGFEYWLKNLPRGDGMDISLQFLMSKDVQIKNYVNSIREGK